MNQQETDNAVSGEREAEELDGTCARCGEIYDLPAGSDPTKYCHDCAHERVAELESTVSGEREQKTDLRSRLIAGGYRSATDGSVRCGLKSCCGRQDCDNFIKATAVMDGTAEIAVSGERVREACAKVCEAKAKELTDVAAVHEKGSTSKVILILQARTATELAQALYVLPLAAQPEGK